MKTRSIKRLAALLLAASMLLCLIPSCTENTTGSTVEEASGQETTLKPAETDEKPSDKEGYTVTVTSAGGLALSDVSVFVYADETMDDLEGYGATDETGTVFIELDYSSTYVAMVTGMPDGYEAELFYSFGEGRRLDIVLTSSVIDDEDLNGVTYKVGDVMHDFTVTDTDGNTHTLSAILEEKELVCINFWYTTCTYCVQEFPFMDAAYQKYGDSVEILCLNNPNFAGDNEAAIKAFKTANGLSMPMVYDRTSISSAIGITGCPTTMFIDRYGVICLIEAGGIMSETPFITAFDHFTAEQYSQKLFGSLSEMIPVEKPNVQMPSSDEIAAVINSGSITVTYSPETNEDDAEMSWPFIIGNKDGRDCIYPSNSKRTSSYATIYATVELKAGQAIGFDYFSSSEQYMDVMYVLINREDIYQISGESEQWASCYPWVATKDGTYELALCYFKDESNDTGDDTVYISNMRVVDAKDIDVATYIPRNCATDRNEDGYGYQNYASVVFNEADGYYHVGTVDGPILLADLMGSTPFSNNSVYMHIYNGDIVLDGVNYYDEILEYCTYSSNATINGLCSVNEELKGLLETVAGAVGIENENEDQWLQICCYYDAYGTGGVQLEDPIKGVANHSAYTAQLGSDNYVYYNRVIMPRGLKYKFVPEASGAYRIESDSEFETEGWIFDENGEIYLTYEMCERLYTDELNVSMVAYLEAGKAYYIDIAFYDVYQVGGFNFSVEFLGSTYDYFRLASPGYFTYYESEDDEIINDTIAGGIEVILGDDGYYHHLKEDGSLGSVLYADFTNVTPLFNTDTVEEMIEKGVFNFRYSAKDLEVLELLAKYGDDTVEQLKSIKEQWGESFDAYAEEYKLYEVMDGIYHGKCEDYTDVMKDYLKRSASSDPQLDGCVKVDKQLADILQLLVDTYSFSGVENSWRKLCYYYDYLGK